MRVHYINVEAPSKEHRASRATLGGGPILPEDRDWPLCRLCKAPMIFFFQFDLQKRFDLPLQSGSHMLVFMCPVHNDVPTQLLEPGEHQLPDVYWDKSFGHYALLLFRQADKEKQHASDGHIAEKIVNFAEAEETIDWDGQIERGSSGFKVGGVPVIGLDARPMRCACGTEMIFLCQLPEAYGFERRKSAPVQPEAVASERYNLFLGHSTFIFACKEQCTPSSLYAVAQDPAEPLVESA